jgi:hypothetical protein
MIFSLHWSMPAPARVAWRAAHKNYQFDLPAMSENSAKAADHSLLSRAFDDEKSVAALIVRRRQMRTSPATINLLF